MGVGALNLLGMGANTAAGWLDFLQAREAAQQQNKLAEEGRQRIEDASGRVYDERLKAIEDMRRNMQTALDDSMTAQGTNLSDFQTRFFGQEGGGFDARANTGFLGELRAREFGRHADTSRRMAQLAADTSVEGERLMGNLERKFAGVTQRADQAVSLLQSGRGEALGALQKDFMYELETESAASFVDQDQALYALEQEFADKDMSLPEVQREYMRQKNAIEKGARGQRASLSRSLSNQRAQMEAAVRMNYDTAIGQAASAAASTVGNAFSSMANAASNIFDTVSKVETYSEGMIADSAKFLSASLTEGASFSANMDRELTNANNVLAQSKQAGQNQVDMLYADGAIQAIDMWGQYQTTVGQMEANFMASIAPVSGIAQNLWSMYMDTEQLEMQERQMTVAERGNWMGLAGAGIGAIGDTTGGFMQGWGSTF